MENKRSPAVLSSDSQPSSVEEIVISDVDDALGSKNAQEKRSRRKRKGKHKAKEKEKQKIERRSKTTSDTRASTFRKG